MLKRLLYFTMFLIGLLSHGQLACSTLTSPKDGDTNVPVNSAIRWSEIPDIIGYVVSFGTTPGGVDILNSRSSGLRNFYIPETGLPADTQIYVTISFFKAGQDYTSCSVETFRTAPVTSPPNCTQLITPISGAINIAAETNIEWNYAPTATGYHLSLGTEPGGTDVFDNLDVGNVLSFEPPEGLPADNQVYVTLIPYNEIGAATPCLAETFTTTSVVIDCSPFFDYKKGELVSHSPELNFPDWIGFCKNRSFTRVESGDTADGYRWYSVNADGTETLISTSKSVELSSLGNYRYEAYNRITRSTNTVECANSKSFTLILSESALITSIDDEKLPDGKRRLQINTTGDGNYEYTLDNMDGPYQNSAVFENVSSDFHYVYVRDKNGCDVTESSVQRHLLPQDFPKFFTPNGDNINDYWQFIAPEVESEIVLTAIHIFDRYGNLIVVLDPDSRGWDGTYNGRGLPSSDYWFRAIALNRQEVKGHFSLKR